MPFLDNFTPGALAFQLIRYVIPTAINAGLIHYAAHRTQVVGDTDWISIPILMICMLGPASLFIDAIGRLRRVFAWQQMVHLWVCLFNLAYFFAIFICCVVSVGAIL